MKKTNIKKIAITALFCSIAFLMTFVFRFKVSFLTFDFKDAIITVCTFLLGPVYGICASAIVALLEFLLISETGFYGLIMNFLASGTYALVSGIIYKRIRKFSGAVLSVSLASVCVVLVMLVANIFITPFYMGVERTDVIALIPSLLLPFNAAKTVINSAMIMIIYKPITAALRRINLIDNKPAKFGLKSVIAAVISCLIIILAVLFVLLVLHGEFKIF